MIIKERDEREGYRERDIERDWRREERSKETLKMESLPMTTR